jgi:hypothetical protein
VAVSLFKHSGETIEWGCRWDGGGLELYHAIAEALKLDQLSSKFPHRVIELLEPYLTQTTGLAKVRPMPEFDVQVDAIMQREVEVAGVRQRGQRWTKGVADELRQRLAAYTGQLDNTERKISAVIGLCQTVAFAHRTRSDNYPSTKTAASSSAEKHLQP